MKINLQGKNIELTSAIYDYVLKRVTDLEKLLSTLEKDGGEVLVNFEVGKSTKHHKSGIVFHSDCLININGKEFYSGAFKDMEHAIVAYETAARIVHSYNPSARAMS